MLFAGQELEGINLIGEVFRKNFLRVLLFGLLAIGLKGFFSVILYETTVSIRTYR